MGGSGGKSQKPASNTNQLRLQYVQQLQQQQQLEAYQRELAQQRADAAAATAKEDAAREQALHDITQKEQDTSAKAKADAVAQAAGSQAAGTGTVAGSVAAKLSAANAAPGLSPFAQAVTKAGNAFYSPNTTQLGGS